MSQSADPTKQGGSTSMADDMRIPESEHISADDSIFNLLPNITISQEDDDFADALYKKAETGFPVRLTAKKLTPGRALAIMERHGFNATHTGRALRTPLTVLTNYIYTRTWLTEIVKAFHGGFVSDKQAFPIDDRLLPNDAIIFPFDRDSKLKARIKIAELFDRYALHLVKNQLAGKRFPPSRSLMSEINIYWDSEERFLQDAQRWFQAADKRTKRKLEHAELKRKLRRHREDVLTD
jgi:hypothetical protein